MEGKRKSTARLQRHFSKEMVAEEQEKTQKRDFPDARAKYQPKSEAETTEQDKDKKIEELTRENERMLMLLKYGEANTYGMYQADHSDASARLYL